MELSDKDKHKGHRGSKKRNYVGSGNNRAAEGAEELCFFLQNLFLQTFFFLRELLPAAVYMWQREHVLAVLNEALIYVLRKPLGEGRGQL
jgi:hypothetical protein